MPVGDGKRENFLCIQPLLVAMALQAACSRVRTTHAMGQERLMVVRVSMISYLIVSGGSGSMKRRRHTHGGVSKRVRSVSLFGGLVGQDLRL